MGEGTKELMTHQHQADKNNLILVVLDGEIIGTHPNTQSGYRLARNERRALKNKALIVRPRVSSKSEYKTLEAMHKASGIKEDFESYYVKILGY
jgi:hypothetical protein